MKFLFHLPLVQLYKHWKILKKIDSVIEETRQLEDFEEKVMAIVKKSNDLDEHDVWRYDDFKSHFKNVASEKELEQMFDKLVTYEELLQKRTYGHYRSHYPPKMSRRLEEILNDAKSTKEKELFKLQSKLQGFKIYEAFAESCLQFILQLSILLNEDPTLAVAEIQHSTLTLFTLTTSLLSVVLSINSLYLEKQFLVEKRGLNHDNDERKEAPYQTLSNLPLVFPIMLLIVTPRLWAIGTLFACCRTWPGFFIIIGTAFVGYAIFFWSFLYFNHRNHGEKNRKLFTLCFLTSIVGPFVVVKPQTRLIFWTCLLSMLGHCIVLFMSLMLLHFNPVILGTYDQHIPTYMKHCYITMCLIFVTSFLSWLLCEDVRQTIGLKTCLGPLCCAPNEQVLWAFSRGYPHLMQHYVNSGQGEQAFLWACEVGYGRAVEFLLDQAEAKNINLNVRNKSGETGLMLAILHDHTSTTAQILMKEAKAKKLDLNAKDKDDNTAFILACRSFNVAILKLLLEDAEVDVNAKDRVYQRTGFHNAVCYGYQTAAVKMLLEAAEERSIDLTAKDRQGKTAFDYGCKNKHLEVIKAILQSETHQHDIISNINKENVTIGEEKILLKMPYSYRGDEGQLNITVDLTTRPANIDIEVVPNN